VAESAGVEPARPEGLAALAQLSLLEEKSEQNQGRLLEGLHYKSGNLDERTILPREHPEAMGFDHHLSHAAAAYFGWGKMEEKVLVLTCDGAGDCACASVSIGERGMLKTIARTEESHSVGAFFGKITYLPGMVPIAAALRY